MKLFDAFYVDLNYCFKKWAMSFADCTCIFVLLIVNLCRATQFPTPPWSGTQDHQDDSDQLLPLVISCHVIILHISHHPGSFCTSEKMRRKLYLYPATTITRPKYQLPDSRLRVPRWECIQSLKALCQTPLLFAKCFVLLAGFLEEVIQSNARRIHEQNTRNTSFEPRPNRFSNNLKRHHNNQTLHYLYV